LAHKSPLSAVGLNLRSAMINDVEALLRRYNSLPLNERAWCLSVGLKHYNEVESKRGRGLVVDGA
jgi:hypothetical protein